MSSLYRLPEELPAVFWVEHAATLRRNWKPVVSTILAGTLASFLISALETRLYHARTTLEVEGITDNLLKAQDGNPNTGNDPEVMDMQTQIRIMQSETLLDRAKNRMGRVADRKALRMAEESLIVRLAGPTRIIEVMADSTNPQIAASFVNALAEEAMQHHVESRWRGTQESAAKMALSLEDMRARLEHSEDALQAYARQSGLIVTAEKASPADDRLREIQADLARAQTERIAKESWLESVTSVADAELPPILHDPAIIAAQEKRADLHRQVAELSATYTPDYPKVKRLQAQIEPLDSEIRSQIAGTRERLRVEFEEARRREQLLAANYQTQAANVSSEAARRVHYDVLKSEVDSTRTLYDTMFARVKQAGIASALRASNVRVLDAARPPKLPFRPQIGQSTLLGALAGVFFGFVFVFGREQMNRTIQGPGDTQMILNVPEFGAVPTTRQFAPGGDPFRTILASILISAPRGESRALVITSADRGDGKTTVTLNLARELAAVGRRVLVIDGDLRCPRLHELLEVPIGLGVADLLLPVLPLTPFQIQANIQPTGIPYLLLLSAGNTGSNAANLLYSSRLKEIVEYSRKNFDIVLIDTPPMLQIPDARVIAQVADAVLIVVRSGKTTREAVLAVRQRLAEDGTTMTGSVLNNWNPRKSPGYYERHPGAFPAPPRAARAHSGSS